MAKYINQWNVPSESNPSKNYVVSLTYEGEWQCSCLGWTRHYPRKDCKHIKQLKEDPLAPLKGVRFAEVR